MVYVLQLLYPRNRKIQTIYTTLYINTHMLYLLSETSTDEDIARFAQHYKLQKTLRYLAQDNSVGDLPVYLPKVFQHIET